MHTCKCKTKKRFGERFCGRSFGLSVRFWEIILKYHSIEVFGDVIGYPSIFPSVFLVASRVPGLQTGVGRQQNVSFKEIRCQGWLFIVNLVIQSTHVYLQKDDAMILVATDPCKVNHSNCLSNLPQILTRQREKPSSQLFRQPKLRCKNALSM